MCIKPSHRVLWSWWTALSILFGSLTVAGIWLGGWLGYLFIPLWLWGGVYLWLRRRRLHYAVTDGYICAVDGVFITTQRMIPIEAVRQTTLWQGPVERLCRTAFILINSTGGYLLIEGVDRQQAEGWCRRLTADG